VSHGAFVAIAVGNEFEEGNPVEYPAAYGPELEGVMAVSAVGKSQARAYYSNTGKAEIAAPGGSNRDGANDDERYVWQVTIHPFDQDPGRVLVPRFDRYAEVGYTGTSMAAPHVAGVAALLMSQGDLKNPRAIEAFIKASARDIGKSGTDDEFGAGLVQAKGALFGTGIRK
jgi:serine protease